MQKMVHSQKNQTRSCPSILYIDDNEDHLVLVKDWLHARHKEFKVVLERDGEGALKRVHSHPFDLILLDYKLAGQDGLELLKRLKLEGVNCPIVILTGQGDEQVAARAIKLGAQEYFTKGAGNLSELVEMIDRLVLH